MLTKLNLIIGALVCALIFAIYQKFKSFFKPTTVDPTKALESKEAVTSVEIEQVRAELKKLTDAYEFKKQLYDKEGKKS